MVATANRQLNDRRGNADHESSGPPSRSDDKFPRLDEEDKFSKAPPTSAGSPIFSVWAGWKKRRVGLGEQTSEADPQEIILGATTKQKVKDEIQAANKTKGKSNVAKGEVGGGNFQNMGEFNPLAMGFVLAETTHLGPHPSLLHSLTLQGFKYRRLFSSSQFLSPSQTCSGIL